MPTAHVHRLPAPWKFALEDLESALAGAVLAGCGALDAQSVGWVPPRQPGAFVHPFNGCWLIALGVEQKLLPAAVVKQAANERAAEILAREGRRVGRKEMRELRGSRIAMILQDPKYSLDPVMPIGAQIEETLQAHAPLPRRERRRDAAQAAADDGHVGP